MPSAEGGLASQHQHAAQSDQEGSSSGCIQHHEGQQQADPAAAARPAHYGSWPAEDQDAEGGNGEVPTSAAWRGRHYRFSAVALFLGAALVAVGMLAAGNTLMGGLPHEQVPVHSSESTRETASIFSLKYHLHPEVPPSSGVIRFAQLLVEGQRGKVGWGAANPETGIQRIECGDSVADGAFDASHTDTSVFFLETRFRGEVGQSFIVECPNCGSAGSRTTV